MKKKPLSWFVMVYDFYPVLSLEIEVERRNKQVEGVWGSSL